MKTTLDLRDDLLARAKELAARKRTTLTRIIEEGLALRLRGNAGGRGRGFVVHAATLPAPERSPQVVIR